MIASLPMYDRPETRGAYVRLWHRIRGDLKGRIPNLPPELGHPTDPWVHWLSPDLILSQTCGLPYRTRLHGKVQLVGTPDYALPGCPPGFYNSVVVTRPGEARDWADLTLAVNSFCSQSGWAAALAEAERRGTRFGATLETGSHRVSAAAVAQGRADIAAIDAQSWRMMRRWDAFTDGLHEAARTVPTPGLPLITASADALSHLTEILARHIATLPEDDRTTLDIKALVTIPPEHYLAVPTPPLHSPEIRA